MNPIIRPDLNVTSRILDGRPLASLAHDGAHRRQGRPPRPVEPHPAPQGPASFRQVLALYAN
jgi:hypothetical protein